MPYSSKVSLLIAEDDAKLRDLLEAAAHRSELFNPIITVDDGQAALDVLHASDSSQLPAVVVSDLSMPRMSGLELLRTVKSDGRLRHISFAILTSSNFPNDRQLAMDAGACSFVPKPYGFEELVRALVAIRESCGNEAGAASRA